MRLGDDDYARLLSARDELRRFLHWSETQARAAKLTPAQHQLLLAVRGHRGGEGEDPTIGDLAAHLLLRHHSTVELVDRAEAAGLVQRVTDADDHRVVRLRLTAEGERRIAQLASAHREEIRRLGTRMAEITAGLEAD